MIREPRRPPPDHFFLWCVGATGTGKTLYASQSYAAYIRNGGRGIVIDTKGGTLDHLGVPVRSVRALVAHVVAAVREGRRFSYVLNARGMSRDQLEAVWALAYQVGRMTVFVDEVDRWAPSVGMSGELRPESLRQLVSWGREQGLNLVTTCRQLSELHPSLKNNASALVSFRQVDGYQAGEVARRYFGNRKDIAEALTTLPDFHYLRAREGRYTRGVVSPPS